MGVLMDPTIGRVIDRCRDGDRDAFDEVVARYGLQVLRTARLIVREDALAEDVCQETFLKAWRRIGSLRDEDPGPWLTRIAANESISAWRRRHRFDVLTERIGRFGANPPTPVSEDRLDLARALDRLSPELRAAIVLHYYHDLSVEQTAAALGVPIDTLKSRLKTALRQLRQLTGAEEKAQ
jgi:RNA polymerase sigma-70 factor (ECF subfamily)